MAVPGRFFEPLNGRPITTPFAWPGSWPGGFHTGIDFDCPVGTPVRAVRGGKVVDNGLITWGDHYGYAVVVQDFLGRRWAYCHLSAWKVGVGQLVQRGDVVGLSGSTRTNRPHLHLEVRTSPYQGIKDMRNPLFHVPLRSYLRRKKRRQVLDVNRQYSTQGGGSAVR